MREGSYKILELQRKIKILIKKKKQHTHHCSLLSDFGVLHEIILQASGRSTIMVSNH